jgi:hydroxymethylglutaryl-CoA reductase (NADPH)
MAAERRAFVQDQTGAKLSYVAQYSFDPAILPGNIENFAGVAQVPIGIAGPILIHGERARSNFYVPMATTEGTPVASYNRGMRLLTECGGVKATVVEQAMQRAPVFICADAVEARDFGRWVNENPRRHPLRGRSHHAQRQTCQHWTVSGGPFALPAI